MKQRAILFGLLFTIASTLLQAQEHTPQELQPGNERLEHERSSFVPADSITISDEGDTIAVSDSTQRASTTHLLLSDTISDAFLAPIQIFKPSPRKAVIYSALFPGMGQVYNRKYWKLPILYGGFVGFTYAITWNNGMYRDYLGAYQDIMDSNPETNRWHNLLPYGRDPETIDQAWFTDVLQKRKDYYRYYRDLSIIGSVALYLLAMVDAYVDAQLFDFDMSPDLTLQVSPALFKEQQAGMLAASSYGLQFSFSF